MVKKKAKKNVKKDSKKKVKAPKKNVKTAKKKVVKKDSKNVKKKSSVKDKKKNVKNSSKKAETKPKNEEVKTKSLTKKIDYDIVEVPHEYADELIKLNQLLRSHREHERDKHIARVEKKLQNALEEIRGMEEEHAAKEEGYPYVKVKVEPHIAKPHKRKSRPPTAYNLFIKNQIEAGATFKQAVKMWKAHKELEEQKKKGIMGRLLHKRTKGKKEEKPKEKKKKGYLEMAKKSITEGEVDISLISKAIVEVLEEKKKVKVDDLSNELGIKPGRILEIVAVIETHDIKVKYPMIGTPRLVLVGKKK